MRKDSIDSATCDLLFDYTHLPYSIQRHVQFRTRIQGLRHEIFIPSFFPSYFIIIKYYSLPFGIDPHCIFIFTTINNRFQLNDTLHTVWQKCAIARESSRASLPLPRFSSKKNFFFFRPKRGASIEHFPREKRSNNEKWHAFDDFRRI